MWRKYGHVIAYELGSLCARSDIFIGRLNVMLETLFNLEPFPNCYDLDVFGLYLLFWHIVQGPVDDQTCLSVSFNQLVNHVHPRILGITLPKGIVRLTMYRHDGLAYAMTVGNVGGLSHHM